MKINVSKATFSSIVGIGQKIRKYSSENGVEFIELNRGINNVSKIDLSSVIPQIDFNSKELQHYPPNTGLESLKESIKKHYFDNKTPNSCISITPGGMPALDLTFQILSVDKIYLPKLFWGSYVKICTIRNKSFSFYDTLNEIDIDGLDDSTAILICDPSNPTGLKQDDNILLNKINEINKKGSPIIFDSPYRKLFNDDDFFIKLSYLENVIITESFSKWIGLSGLRLGFIYSKNSEFNDELNIRLLYEFNGISSASQLIVNKLLSTKEGEEAINNFRNITKSAIKENIQFLSDKNLLVKEIYGDTLPIGIFAIINKDEEFLFQNGIGSVGLDKFVYKDKDVWSKYSRICVSINTDLFRSFLSKI
jgi:aspartate/methionine/tyrosine aminotransferase